MIDERIVARKGQFATEYLIIAGFMLFALLGGIYLFYTSSPPRESVDAQIQLLGNTLTDTAHDVYFIGKPSKVTLEVIFPGGLRNLTVNPAEPKELIIQYDNPQGGIAEKVFLSRVRLATNVNLLGRGRREMVLEAKQDTVSLCVIEKGCDCDGICSWPTENYTSCAPDCCASEQPGVGLGGRTCRTCNNTRSPYTCNLTDAFLKTACDGHNGCDCSRMEELSLGTCS